MQHPYNWDIQLHHNIVPWTLILYVIWKWSKDFVRIPLSTAQSMWCIFQCVEDCGSEQPEKHAGGHPAIFGILHLTNYVLGHSKYFSGNLNSALVWVLEGSVGLWVQARYFPVWKFYCFVCLTLIWLLNCYSMSQHCDLCRHAWVSGKVCFVTDTSEFLWTPF